MSRLVLLLGILLVIVGGAGMVIGLVGVPFQIASTISQAVNPDAAALCAPGEALVTEEGADSCSPASAMVTT